MSVSPSGNFYVTDIGPNKVMKCSYDFVCEEIANFSFPQGVSVDTQETVYVTAGLDSTSGPGAKSVVKRCDPSGKCTDVGGPEVVWKSPYGIWAGPNNVYVANSVWTGPNYVAKRSGPNPGPGPNVTDKNYGVWNCPSDGPCKLVADSHLWHRAPPASVAVDSHGNLYVSGGAPAMGGSSTWVRKCTPNAKKCQAFGSGWDTTSYLGIGALTVDVHDNVYVVEDGTTVFKCTGEGVCVALVLDPLESMIGVNDNHFGIYGLAVDASGAVYVAGGDGIKPFMGRLCP